MTVNFIRMEFFRLTKMKALIVLPIILVVIMFVQTFFLLRFNPEGALVSALGLESVATQLGGSSENYSMFGKGEGYNYTVAQTFVDVGLHVCPRLPDLCVKEPGPFWGTREGPGRDQEDTTV